MLKVHSIYSVFLLYIEVTNSGGDTYVRSTQKFILSPYIDIYDIVVRLMTNLLSCFMYLYENKGIKIFHLDAFGFSYAKLCFLGVIIIITST